MREINLGALKQQFNKAYASERRIQSAQATRLSQLDLKDMVSQGQHELRMMQNERVAANENLNFDLRGMSIGLTEKLANKAIESRTRLGLMKTDIKEKRFLQDEKRQHDAEMRGIERERLAVIDKINRDTSMRKAFSDIEHDAETKLRDIALDAKIKEGQLRRGFRSELGKVNDLKFVQGALRDIIEAQGGRDSEKKFKRLRELTGLDFYRAHQLIHGERATWGYNDEHVRKWLDILNASHNPPIVEEWRRDFDILHRLGGLDLNEQMRRHRLEEQGYRVNYFLTPRGAASAGYQPPSQQAATSAVIAENQKAVQSSMRDAAKGTAMTLQNLHNEQDSWLAQSATQAAWDKAEELKRHLGGLSVADRKTFLQSGAVNAAFTDILEFYSGIQSPLERKRVERAIKKYISEVKIDSELASIGGIQEETKAAVNDAKRRLSTSVVLNPTEEGISAAKSQYDDAVGALYKDPGSIEFARQERDALVFKSKLASYLGDNKDTQNFKAAEKLLKSPKAKNFLTPKEVLQAYSTLKRASEKHARELKAKNIKSIQQWADTYGKSKSLVKSALSNAIKLKDFSSLKQLKQNKRVLPEDIMIIDTMLAKAKAKLTPEDGNVRGFAANEPIGYRGSRYKLGRDNKLVSDANGSRDMVVENSFREAFNKLLHTDPVNLREQILGTEDDPTTAIQQRALYGGRSLTNAKALELGGALNALLGANTEQQMNMMHSLKQLYGEHSDIVVEEALLTLFANTTDPMQKSRVQIARMTFNPHLRGVLPEPIKANYLRGLQTEGKITATVAGVTAESVPESLQAIRDSVPAWTYRTLENIVQQGALYKTLNTTGNERAKQSVYKAEMSKLSEHIAATINLSSSKYGEGKTIEGVAKAISGLMAQDGSLDVPQSVLANAGVDAPLRARDFAESLSGSEMAKHRHIFEANTLSAIHAGGPHAKYKLVKREDRPGSFVVVLEQGDVVFPLTLKDGSLLTTLAEDIFVRGSLFNRLGIKATAPTADAQIQRGF